MKNLALNKKTHGPDLPLLFKLHEIWSVDSQEHGIIKIVATRCQILRLKCTRFDFGRGSALDPAGGAYSVPADPLAGCKGPTSEGREVMGEEGRGWDGRGAEKNGKRTTERSPSSKFAATPLRRGKQYSPLRRQADVCKTTLQQCARRVT